MDIIITIITTCLSAQFHPLHSHRLATVVHQRQPNELCHRLFDRHSLECFDTCSTFSSRAAEHFVVVDVHSTHCMLLGNWDCDDCTCWQFESLMTTFIFSFSLSPELWINSGHSMLTTCHLLTLTLWLFCWCDMVWWWVGTLDVDRWLNVRQSKFYWVEILFNGFISFAFSSLQL